MTVIFRTTGIEVPVDPDRPVFWFNDEEKVYDPYRYTPVDVISDLIHSMQDKGREISYLEIGVDEGETFDKIKCSIKHGVDPYGGSPNITHKMTSQMFFAMNEYFFHNFYDVVFIDGCHMASIIAQEVMSASHILKPGGFIVLHDTAPVTKNAQGVFREDYDSFINEVVSQEENNRISFRENTEKNGWIGYNGDAWKVVAALRGSTPWHIFSIPEACCTVISLKEQTNLAHHDLISKVYSNSSGKIEWEDYVCHYDLLMNPMLYKDLKVFLKEI